MDWEFDWLYALQEIHNPVMDKLMVFFSHLGDIGLLWIGLGIICCIPKRTRKCGIQVLLSIAVTFIIGNLILKNLVARERPCWLDPGVALLLESPSDYSFPSGHSMNGFTAAVSILCNNRKAGIVAVIVASVIAFSRLYNFLHFPTDVLFGILLGSVVAVLVYKITDGRLRSRLHC